MFFFTDVDGHLVEAGRTIGVQGGNQQAAVAMSQRIWDGLAGGEPALGYSLLDTLSGRVFYVEVRQSKPKALGISKGVKLNERPQKAVSVR
jgi:hypothetical protein